MTHSVTPPPSSATTPTRPRKLWRELWPILAPLLLLWLALWLVAAPAVVRGDSMRPTLHTGNVLLLEKYPRLNSWKPARGDIVVFRGAPNSPYAWETRHLLGLEYRARPAHIKRVLAVAGDRVGIAGGQLRVNGAAVPDLSAQQGYLDDLAPLTVPAGAVWVMGDNHLVGASLDSRTYGPIRVADVLGRVHWQLWPRLKQVE